jgi:hypothetical protein
MLETVVGIGVVVEEEEFVDSATLLVVVLIGTRLCVTKA